MRFVEPIFLRVPLFKPIIFKKQTQNMDKKYTVLLMLLLAYASVSAQTLGLSDALSMALNNYELIKAKSNYLKASEAKIQESERDYWPELKLSAQQSYGTINAQNGPMYGFGGLGVASTSMPLPENNWNAAFGSLYLANINWEFFTFGQTKNKIQLAQIGNKQRSTDLEQEQFQHQIKVAGAYLNLLAIQRMIYVQEQNVERAEVFLTTVLSLAESGMKPMVDTSLAKAEVSNAKIGLLRALDKEIELSKVLAMMIGVDYTKFKLDESYSNKQPLIIQNAEVNELHPLLAHKQTMIDFSDKQTKLLRSENLPKFSLFGVVQGRGSGFKHNYVQDNTAFSQSYADGVGIDRGNYLVGVGVTWSVSSLFRNHSKIRNQEYTTQALQDEYRLLNRELKTQTAMADDRIGNALAHKKESPIQVEAASQAYKQHVALYKNGLSNVADLTQAFYALNRAETDNEIASINVWQALLLKASSSGHLDVFTNELK